MQAVILSAGRGARMRPVSDHRSKAMMPAVGKPLVERVLETLVSDQVRELVMVIGPAWGCSTSTAICRCCTCGSSNT